MDTVDQPMPHNAPEQNENNLRLLEANHSFPCEFTIKVIGRTEQQFVERVVAAVRLCQQLDCDPPFRVRTTPNGRHVSVTVEPRVESAADVLVIYQRMRDIAGVVLIM
jgi:putative lipoic acid-binding regulatory protein